MGVCCDVVRGSSVGEERSFRSNSKLCVSPRSRRDGYGHGTRRDEHGHRQARDEDGAADRAGSGFPRRRRGDRSARAASRTFSLSLQSSTSNDSSHSSDSSPRVESRRRHASHRHRRRMRQAAPWVERGRAGDGGGRAVLGRRRRASPAVSTGVERGSSSCEIPRAALEYRGPGHAGDEPCRRA